MAHFFSVLFFSLCVIAMLALVAVMLREEWPRVAEILSGRELQAARAAAPQVRVRLRSWARIELNRTVQPPRRAAAA